MIRVKSNGFIRRVLSGKHLMTPGQERYFNKMILKNLDKFVYRSVRNEGDE